MAENLLLIGGIWLCVARFGVGLGYVALGAYAVSIVMTFIITFAAADFALEPLHVIWQAIVHIAPSEQRVAAPDLKKVVVGRMLVANLTSQIYQIASVAETTAGVALKQSANLKANFVANNLPLPLFVLDAEQMIVFANNAAGLYTGRDPNDLIGQDVHGMLNMLFPSEDTLQAWLTNAGKSSVTASKFWERVRIDVSDNQPLRMFDLAAYYNKGNAQHYETMLVLFDHTKSYRHPDPPLTPTPLPLPQLQHPPSL